MFKRRNPKPIIEMVASFFYPKRGWSRAVTYVGYRLKRLPDTPHRIALGFACGVFVCFSPFFGVHFVYAWLCARLLNGNILSALMGTFFGNPITFPFIATMSYQFGNFLLGVDKTENAEHLLHQLKVGWHGIWRSLVSIFSTVEPEWGELKDFAENLIFPYFIGGLLPGLLAGTITYFIMKPLIAKYQQRRYKIILKKAAMNSSMLDNAMDEELK